ncbi:hypothetical protein [Rhizobium sp. GCM10022189]|jgi:hypothetical protein|uniref:hypothetical protein n=1 Tax=Rhizobium sp. GCM10022189 TaxID=3252654 RepID=UPI000DD559E0
MKDKNKSVATRSGLPWGAALGAEILSAIQIPGGNLLTKYVDAYQERKRAEAHEVLLEEITAGRHGPVDFEADDIESFIAVTLRFAKAMEMGTAHENLRLLAQVIAGLKKNKALTADTFMRWAGVLEQMTRDELVTIGIAYKTFKAHQNDPRTEETGVWVHILTGMLNAGYSEDDIAPLASCVTRYGLLSLYTGYGGVAGYEPTSWLMELGELADLELVMPEASNER